MSRHENPFDDILQPQPRSAKGPAFQDDPFAGDDEPGVFEQIHNAYGGAVNSFGGGEDGANTQIASSSRNAGIQQGYTLDPFFDE